MHPVGCLKWVGCGCVFRLKNRPQRLFWQWVGYYATLLDSRHTGATVRYIFREARGQGCSVLRTLPSYPLGSDEYHLSPFRNDFTPIFCLAIFSVRLEISSSLAWLVISSDSISPSESKSFNSFSACAVLLSNEPFPHSSSSTVVSQ